MKSTFIFWFKSYHLNGIKRSWTVCFVCAWTCCRLCEPSIELSPLSESQKPNNSFCKKKWQQEWNRTERNRTEPNVIKTGGKPEKNLHTQKLLRYRFMWMCKRSTTFTGTCTLHCNPMMKRRRKRSVVTKRNNNSKNSSSASNSIQIRHGNSCTHICISGSRKSVEVRIVAPGTHTLLMRTPFQVNEIVRLKERIIYLVLRIQTHRHFHSHIYGPGHTDTFLVNWKNISEEKHNFPVFA